MLRMPRRLTLVAGLLMLALQAAAADVGDAVRGAQTLASHQCLGCHAFQPQWILGSDSTPRKTPRKRLTPAGLAAAIWNHAPTMWSAIARSGQPISPFTQQESADAITYFFAAGYFDGPGDPDRGESVFTGGGCHVCHLMDSPQGGGPAVSSWGVSNVTDLLQGLWSHWPAMNAAMGRRRLVWPAIDHNQMRDLLAFVRSRYSGTGKSEMRIGSSESGKILIEKKGCVSCHQGDMSIGQYSRVGSFNELAASFWNHIPMMTRPPAVITREEMADILAYLWTSRYFEEEGSARRGERVFQSKQCGKCHPAQQRPDFDVAAMVSALWKHSPAALSRSGQSFPIWPTFLPGEMEDLIAYYRGAAR